MDDTIRRLLKEKPDKGLELAMRQYMGLCYVIVRTQLGGMGTKEDIEDCVSEAFAALYEARGKLDKQKGTVRSFLAVLARRRAIDCYHRLNREAANRAGQIKEREGGEGSPAGEAAEYFGRQPGNPGDFSDRTVLIELLKELGPPDTEIFLRKYFLGQSTKEIAGALGLKTNTVDKKVQRGLAKLRTLMEGGQ